MSMRSALLIALSAGLSACGAPGLPPAGSASGDVDIGYGTQPAANVTGRVTTITEKQIRESSAQSVKELLRRRNIVPVPKLIVIDGVRTQQASAIDTYHPNEIRQIDVLRDLSASNIYGAAGRDGGLIITTRR